MLNFLIPLTFNVQLQLKGQLCCHHRSAGLFKVTKSEQVDDSLSQARSVCQGRKLGILSGVSCCLAYALSMGSIYFMSLQNQWMWFPTKNKDGIAEYMRWVM